MNNIVRMGVWIGTAALLLGMWEGASATSRFTAILISSPLKIVEFAIVNWLGLMQDLFHTLLIAVCGLSLAIAVGGAIGAVGSIYERAGYRLELTSTILQSVPLVVFAPFAIIMFGVGYTSKILLAFIMAIFPMIIGVIVSSRRASAQFNELFKLYKLTALERLLEIYLPYMLPTLLAYVRVSAGLAILGAVIAEFTGSNSGLGRNIFLGTVRLDPELMMTSLMLTCVLGLAVHIGLQWAERKSAWWEVK